MKKSNIILTILFFLIFYNFSITAAEDEVAQSIAKAALGKVNVLNDSAAAFVTDTELNNLVTDTADWNNVTNKPDIPDTEPYLLKADSIVITKVSELQNDSGFVTEVKTDTIYYYDTQTVYNTTTVYNTQIIGGGDTTLPALTLEQYDSYPASRYLELGYGLDADTSTPGKFVLSVDQNILNTSGSSFNLYSYLSTQSFSALDTYTITITDTEFQGYNTAGAAAFVKYNDTWYINTWQIGISESGSDTMSFIITVFDSFDTSEIKILIYDGIYNSQLIFNDTVIFPYATYIFNVDNLSNSLVKQFIYIDSSDLAVDTGYINDNSNLSISFDYTNNKIICVSNINDTIYRNQLMLQIISLTPGQNVTVQQNSSTLIFGYSGFTSSAGIEYAEAWVIADSGTFSDTNVYNYTKDSGNIEASIYKGLFNYQIDYLWSNESYNATNVKIKKFKF